MPESGVKLDTSLFKGLKLVVSTPMMGNSVCDDFADSRDELFRYFSSLGVEFAQSKVRDTYLPRGRNVLAAAMLETDAKYHLLLDSDMGWNSEDVLRMIYHAVSNPEIEVIGAGYPQKYIDWQRVIEAVGRNPKVTPEQLAAIAPGRWTFRGIPEGQHNLGFPIELKSDKKPPHVGTGIMLIKRSAYEYMKSHSDIEYIDFQSRKTMWRFFHADTTGGEWIGEDVWFCRLWHQMGGKVWLAPWVRTKHVGTMAFVGDASLITDAGMEVPQ